MTPRLPACRPTGLALATLALTAAAVAGCGAQGADGTAGSASSPAPAPTTPADTAPPSNAPATDSPAPDTPASDPPATGEPDQTDEPDATPPGRAGEPAGPAGALLTAEQLPGFTEAFDWTVAETRDREGRKTFGTCQQFALTSIGASRVVVREFAPAPGSGARSQASAGELVARFPDSMTAKRAYQVLLSWHDGCAEQLADYRDTDVGPVQQVELETGAATGFWYLLTYGPAEAPDTAYFDAQGVARAGRRIVALSMRVQGQDYDYPAGAEPMVTALRRAVQQLR